MGRRYLYPDEIQPGSSATTSNLQVASAEYKDTEHAGTVSEN